MMRRKSQVKPPLVLRVSSVLSACLFALALGAAAFVGGYSVAFLKVQDALAETTLLKAKAADLETEILRLKNYATLIDAIAVQGQAAERLQNLPSPVPTTATTDSVPALGGW